MLIVNYCPSVPFFCCKTKCEKHPKKKPLKKKKRAETSKRNIPRIIVKMTNELYVRVCVFVINVATDTRKTNIMRNECGNSGDCRIRQCLVDPSFRHFACCVSFATSNSA